MDVMGSGQAGEASSVKVASASLDISERGDVNTLRKSAIGLSGVLFISFAAMSPLTGQLGNVPLAIGLGNGIGAPAGFEIGIVMLVLFSVGYVKMMRSVPSSGGFYSFISHGLGRPLGMAAGGRRSSRTRSWWARCSARSATSATSPSRSSSTWGYRGRTWPSAP
jgi:hypothetical protein